MKRTTFVLGAGASADFNLPVGTQLRNEIVDLLQGTFPDDREVAPYGESALARACSEIGLTTERARGASDIIRRGIYWSNSVDDFLSESVAFPDVVELGRLAIAECIVKAERRAAAHLSLDAPTIEGRRGAAQMLSEAWLGSLFRQLKRGYSRERAIDAFSDVSFIVFNYDRCLEQFLFWAIHDAFGLDQDETRKVVKSIPILHVYGSLGNLPAWMEGDVVNFGAEQYELHLMAKRIKTYTEQLKSEEVSSIQGLMEAAENVVYLGYAFHQQGLDILYPTGPRPGQNHYGTLWQLGGAAQERAKAVASAGSEHYASSQNCVGYVNIWGPTFMA